MPRIPAFVALPGIAGDDQNRLSHVSDSSSNDEPATSTRRAFSAHMLAACTAGEESPAFPVGFSTPGRGTFLDFDPAEITRNGIWS
jgi:hypothetical protein